MPYRKAYRRWLLISAAIIIVFVAVWLLRMESGRRIVVGEPVDAITFSPDGRLVATTSAHGLQLWNASDQHLVRTFAEPWGSAAIAWSLDGQFLAVEGPAYTVRVWRVSDGVLIFTLVGHTLPSSPITFSPDGSLLAAAGGDDTVIFWQMRDGTPVPLLRAHTSGVDDVAFSADGQSVALHRVDGAIQVWRLRDERLLDTLAAGQTGNMLFSPDGRLLAASLGKTILVWRIADGAVIYYLGHDDWVNSLAFSPDGQWLASGAGNTDTSDDIKDTTVRLWRMHDGALVKVLEGHHSVVRSVAFSPDGQTLASGSWDGTVRLWPVQEP